MGSLGDIHAGPPEQVLRSDGYMATSQKDSNIKLINVPPASGARETTHTLIG
jgi:hypothetical protein